MPIVASAMALYFNSSTGAASKELSRLLLRQPPQWYWRLASALEIWGTTAFTVPAASFSSEKFISL